jgi:hypothetical protein
MEIQRIEKLKSLHVSDLSQHFPSFTTYTLRYVIRSAVFFCLVYYFGFIIGTILTILSIFLYKESLKYILKLEWTNYEDKFTINQDSKYNITLAATMTIEDFDKTEIRKEIKEKLFDQVPKLSSHLVAFFADFYWTTPQVRYYSNDKKEKILKERIVDVKMKEQDYNEFLESEINTHLNPFICPIKFYIVEIENNDKLSNSKKGVVLLKLDHSLGDGLGLTSLIGFLDKNFDIEKYPAIMRRRSGGVTYYIKTIYDYILAIVFGLYGIIRYLILSKSKEYQYQGFYKYKKNCKIDKPSKYYFSHCSNNSGLCLISNTITIDLKRVKDFSRKYKISINDFLVYCILKTYKDLSPESKYVSYMIPVGFTGLPKSIKEMNLYNQSSGYLELIKLPEATKHEDYINVASTKFKLVDVIGNLYKVRTVQMMNWLLDEFCHNVLFNLFRYINYPEFTISNVPAQEREIYIGKCKVSNIIPLASSSAISAFIAICSYNGQLNIKISMDTNTGFDPDKVMAKTYKIINDYLDS